jgi:hypothetical protein
MSGRWLNGLPAGFLVVLAFARRPARPVYPKLSEGFWGLALRPSIRLGRQGSADAGS